MNPSISSSTVAPATAVLFGGIVAATLWAIGRGANWSPVTGLLTSNNATLVRNGLEQLFVSGIAESAPETPTSAAKQAA